MKVRVNGTERELAQDITVAGMLTAIGAPPTGVAVAMNGAVVPKTGWAATVVPDGATVEVLTAVQGG